jgi:hypothetical protein
MPTQLREALEAKAKEQNRTLHHEILARPEASLERERSDQGDIIRTLDDLTARLAALEAQVQRPSR